MNKKTTGHGLHSGKEIADVMWGMTLKNLETCKQRLLKISKAPEYY